MESLDTYWFNKNLASFQRNLLTWFYNHKRNLPWRKSRSPYAIWVSEVMLQQTRVDTVIPYFNRFLSKYPDIQALASADRQDVLKSLEGVGYYSRVRNLHKTAQVVVDQFDGVFPHHFDDLIKLPGIGAYTAGAIASIAFGQPIPVVDGNVMRVLSRLFEIEWDITESATKKYFWQLSSQLINRNSPGEYNQAMMELGATVCIPREPHCERCPLSENCLAKQNNRQGELPIRKAKSPIPHHQIGAGLIWRDGSLLITRRPENGLLGGLWEFPGGKRESDETIRQCIEREITEELDIRVQARDHFMTVKHAYTHFRITLDVYHCHWIIGEPACHDCTDFRWVSIHQLDDFPFPRANKKVIEELLAQSG